MTDLEQLVETRTCDVESSRLNLQSAEIELRNGERFMMEAREKYGKLKIAVEIAKINLRREETYLAKAKSDASKGFADLS